MTFSRVKVTLLYNAFYTMIAVSCCHCLLLRVVLRDVFKRVKVTLFYNALYTMIAVSCCHCPLLRVVL